MPSQPGRTARGPVRRAGRVAGATLVLVLAAGCAAGGLPSPSGATPQGSGGTATPAGTAAAGPADPTLVPTGNPAAPTPSPVPAVPRTPTPTDPWLDGPGEEPTPTERPSLPPGPAIPPPLSLALPNGGTVAGALGSYTWRGAGSDAPWIVPPLPLAIRTGGPYAVSVDPTLGIDTWRVSWAPVVTDPETDDTVGDVAGWEEGSGRPIRFAGPTTPGSWSLALEVRFADGSHAAWFWRLEAGA